MSEPITGPDLRETAKKHLEKRRGFVAHLLVYVLVNATTVILWMFTGHGFFWPVFLIAFWGIGLIMNAWDVFVAHEITEADVDREVRRMQHH
ncbi:MAG: 2TM domain-containing protein [Nocardioides sp.]